MNAIAHQIRFGLVVLVFTASCLAKTQTSPRPRFDASVITAEQIEAQHYTNVYEAVLALRSNWLSTRGTDSFRTPSQVWVYLDNSRLGGVQTLAGISTQGVTEIKHLTGIEATARWGIGHSAGAIMVLTWPNGAPDSTADGAARDSIAHVDRLSHPGGDHRNLEASASTALRHAPAADGD